MAVACALCLGCGSGYGGELLTDGVGRADPNARRVGCIDVRVASVTDAAADESYPVVAYDFGNRCDHLAPVDLGSARVVAAYPGEPAAVLRPFDPEGAIAPGLLDGRATGREVVAYLSPPTQLERPAWFCVDVARLSEGDREPPDVCFDWVGEEKRWRVRS